MNQYSQGESSAGLSVQPLKRGRGRPRKDPSLKKTQAARVPPGFEGVKEPPQRVDRTDGVDSMVGQAVTGVVEAIFDAGYLLSVRIGNSTTSLRGVVFKPGHYVPVTAENDVAPHLPMIRRNDVPVPAGNQALSRRQKLAVVPSKRRYGSPQMAPTVPPVGARGNVVPVVLQPLNFPNGSQTSNQVPTESSPAANMMAFGDKDVHMVEPLSMFPPDHSVPVSQIFLGSQPHMSNQVPQGTMQNESKPFIKTNPMASTEFGNPGSSDTSETQTDSGKEESKSSAEDSGIVSKPLTATISSESLQSDSMKPFLNYGTGRMTELLHAVQENMKENQVQITEQPPPSVSKVEVHETMRIEADDPKKEASAP
ncbi:hypothetical protein ACS0TY_016719 [Phlomoides rotata]